MHSLKEGKQQLITQMRYTLLAYLAATSSQPYTKSRKSEEWLQDAQLMEVLKWLQVGALDPSVNHTMPPSAVAAVLYRPGQSMAQVCHAESHCLAMQAAADADEINLHEKLFGMASTKYGQVSRMAAKLEPYCNLWTLAARFYDKYAGWMSGPFSKLKPEEVETEVSDAYRKIYKLSKVSLPSTALINRLHLKRLVSSVLEQVCSTSPQCSDQAGACIGLGLVAVVSTKLAMLQLLDTLSPFIVFQPLICHLSRSG